MSIINRYKLAIKIKKTTRLLFLYPFIKFVYIKTIEREKMAGKKVEVAGIMGPVWAIGWLFTLGFLKLTFWKGFLAILVWPYYIGDYLSKYIG